MAEFDLGQKVGPLPMGAWIAVVGGGLAIAYFINRNQQAEAPDTVQLTPSGVGSGGGQFISEPPTTEGPPDEEVEDTNAKWGQRVVNWLISQGNDPGIADNAVRKYLSGDNLTSREQALINLALPHFGVPPEPLPPTKVPDGGGSGDLTKQPGDDPQIQVSLSPVTVRRGKPVRATGRAWYTNRNTPSGARTVTVITWHAGYRPGVLALSRQFVRTDEGGRFKYTLGYTKPDRGRKYRYYTFRWQGASKTVRVRIV